MSVAKAVLALTILVSSYSASDDVALARATNVFGINLLRELSSVKPRQNIVFSPSSISAEIAMVYAGAAGQCAEETSRVLGHITVGLLDRDTVLAAYKKRINDTSDIIMMANVVLVRNTSRVLDTYKKTLQDVFAAQFKSVDFLAYGYRMAAEINGWMSEKTEGRVKKGILDGMPMNTAVYVVSAASLANLPWISQFEPNNTRILPFFNHGIELTMREVMTATANIRHAKLPDLESEAIELLGTHLRRSMVIVLPDSITGLSKLRATFNAENINDIEAELRSQRVNLRLPKFKINNRHNLVPTLRGLGINCVFGTEPDLSKMSCDKNLYVSEIAHVAVMTVNEEGAGFINPTPGWTPSAERAMRLRPLDFYVDHPFLFYIRDRLANTILLMGEVHEL
ncbi:unnamed protein product [Ixodes pacificus]